MRTGERNTFDSVIGRAAALLGAFDARHLAMGVSELSRRSGLAKSTTARLAAELAEHGFLERTEGSDYKLGTKLFELGSNWRPGNASCARWPCPTWPTCGRSAGRRCTWPCWWAPR